MKTDLQSLMQRSPAEVSFSGLGVWDVFKSGWVRVGRVAFDQNRPPFVRSDDPEYSFAPDFYFFPMGLVQENQKMANQ